MLLWLIELQVPASPVVAVTAATTQDALVMVDALVFLSSLLGTFKLLQAHQSPRRQTVHQRHLPDHSVP